MLQYIATTLATGLHELREIVETKVAMKDDVKKLIGEAKQELMAYTDKRVTEAENKFIMPLRREDEKVDEVVDSAQQRKLFDQLEAARLKNLGPFPKLVVG